MSVLHCSFVSPSLPVVIDSQAKIQSKPGPHGWCHWSNLTNPAAKAEHTGLLMPSYLQPINIDLIRASGKPVGVIRGLFLPALSFCRLLPLLLHTSTIVLFFYSVGRDESSHDATYSCARFLFPLLKKVRRKVCWGLHQATCRGKFESCFLSGREGGEAIVPAETMGAAGRHAAVRTWMAGLRDVCGSVTRGLGPKVPFPAPHNESAQGRGS